MKMKSTFQVERKEKKNERGTKYYFIGFDNNYILCLCLSLSLSPI